MRDGGFTLIEIMIVVAIIAVLAAIAIPQFSVYRTNSYNKTAVSDLKNAAIAQEAYYVENHNYSKNLNNLTAAPFNLSVSHGVSIEVTYASDQAYVMTGSHRAGSVIYTLSGPGGTISP